MKYRREIFVNIPFYIIIFYTMIAQGGYFKISLIVLNIFLFVFILSKKSLKIDNTFILLTALSLGIIISAIFLSLTAYTAMGELIVYSIYPLSYLVFLNTQDKDGVKRAFKSSISLTAICGILGVIGFLPGMLNGDRMHSFLQYANATSLLMGVGIFYCTNDYINHRKKVDIAMAALLLVALLMTKSRIGFVVFSAVYLIYLLKNLNAKGKLTLFVVFFSISAALFLTGSRIFQLSLFQPTLVERYISYWDGTKLAFRNFFGLGPGNWQFMQFYYQSAPYQIRYIHNAYIQVAQDGGVFSFVVFIYLIVQSLRQRGIHFFICLFMAIAGLFEVHFRFGIFIILFTFSLANSKEDGRLIGCKYSRYILLIPICLLSIFLVSEYSVNRGQRFARQGKSQQAYNAYEMAIKNNPFNYDIYLKMAVVEKNPITALELLETAHSKNGWDVNVLFALAEGYSYKGDFEKSYYYANKLLSIFPYSIKNQMLVRDILGKFYTDGIISEEEYNQLSSHLETIIEEKNSMINPLYRYIDDQMQY